MRCATRTILAVRTRFQQIRMPAMIQAEARPSSAGLQIPRAAARGICCLCPMRDNWEERSGMRLERVGREPFFAAEPRFLALGILAGGGVDEFLAGGAVGFSC